MAKAKSFLTPDKKEVYKYPTRFGSHAMMIDEEKTAALSDPTKVVLLDEHGHYTTDRNRLDTRMADPNRYAESRLGNLFVRNDKG